jgi:formylglycine-generating enzyme required for sulfatase activity
LPAALRLRPIEALRLTAGQRLAMPVRIERENCRGPVQLRLEDLPASVTAKCRAVPADANESQVEFRVAAGADNDDVVVRVEAQAAGARTQGTFRLTTVRRPLEAGKEIENSIGMRLGLIPAGKFLMGASPNEPGGVPGGAQREVKIPQAFYMGVYEVTQEEYLKIMGNTRSRFATQGVAKEKLTLTDTRRFPVENVAWGEAVAFCTALSGLPAEKRAQRVYQLPTEKEWEYACRAGDPSSTPYHFGPTLSAEEANISAKLGRPTTVGSYPPNNFGLYDMHGNVSEWCQEFYDRSVSAPRGKRNPENRHVVRGGSWLQGPEEARSDGRLPGPAGLSGHVGFRVVCRRAP